MIHTIWLKSSIIVEKSIFKLVKLQSFQQAKCCEKRKKSPTKFANSVYICIEHGKAYHIWVTNYVKGLDTPGKVSETSLWNEWCTWLEKVQKLSSNQIYDKKWIDIFLWPVQRFQIDHTLKCVINHAVDKVLETCFKIRTLLELDHCCFRNLVSETFPGVSRL